MVERHGYSVRNSRLVGPDLMRHEAVHSDQYTRFATVGAFVDAYERNQWKYEDEANLYWGGYREAPPGYNCPYAGATDNP
jgi:hypothetical protein